MTAATMTAVSPFTHVNSMANGAGTGQDSAKAATISSNDFLTLLVSEMKNQDPTAQTDPNEYVNQLVQVNSLEQLIEINGNLSSALGTTTDAAGAKMSAAHSRGTLVSASDASGAGSRTGTKGTSSPIPVSANPISSIAGNLGVPRSNPAAQRIAQALSGRK